MISEASYKDTAKLLGVEVATVKAVAFVESGGSGFLPDGRPMILFEPHVFWKQLKLMNIDPEKHEKGNEDILYPRWGMYPYGTIGMQHERMERAALINRDAALCSASWGKFQIMGYHYKTCKCSTLQEFVNLMYKDEESHLLLFAHFLLSTELYIPLQLKRWATFAKGFNGHLYKKNYYDSRLAEAYKKFKKA